MPNLIAKLRSIPIWVRVSGIIALVLVGVVVSSMLLGGSSGMDHEGGRDRSSQMGGMEGMDHNGGQTEQVVPSAESQPAENPTPSGHQIPTRERRPSDVPDDPTATPSHGSGDHTRSDGSRSH
jgi:hypothetical protein